MLRLTLALALLLIPTAPGAMAKKGTPRATFACTLLTSPGGVPVTLTKRYGPDRAAVSGIESYGEVSDAVKAMFEPVIDKLAQDLPKNCNPAKGRKNAGEVVHRYVCDISWQSGGDIYSIIRPSDYGESPYALPKRAIWYWERDMGDGVKAQMHADVSPEARAGGPLFSTFNTHLPLLWVDQHGKGTSRNYGINNVWTYQVWTDVRKGKQVYKEWAVSNVYLSLRWHEWPKLVSGEGDYEISAHDTEKGLIFKKTLPGNFLETLEKELMSGIQKFKHKEDAPIENCRLAREEFVQILIRE